MNYPELSLQIQEYVTSYFHLQKSRIFIYHNLHHTQNVVKAATQIANHYQLNERDFFIVTTAAWFHDAGYFEDMNNHEVKGKDMAATFLRAHAVGEDVIEAVSGCILATRLPQQPLNRLEEIVCDADLFHLGTEDFQSNNKLMRREAEARKGMPIDKDEWRLGTIRLFESHHYYTDYCQLLLNQKKKENLERLKKKAAEKEEKHHHENHHAIKSDPPAEATATPSIQPATEPAVVSSAASKPITPMRVDQKRRKEEKAKRPDRGIETMFRITSGNNQRLSDMADNKSHIMITVNSIILSAIISLLLRKLDEYYFLKFPTFLTLGVCVTTIIFSILATRPSIPSGKFTQEDIDQKKVNLLFFGNFYRMNLQDYTSGMLQVMSDRDFLYGTLIKDVYSQGVVLGRKYRLLRISYNIFMYGLIISVLAFVAATIFWGK
jgi:predicted metal-dependent HD superfamily phosphohydrolase